MTGLVDQLGFALFVGLLILGADAAVWSLSRLADRLRDLRADEDDVDPVAAAQRAYVEGEIDEVELERRLALAVDDRAQAIRAELEAIDGVGPVTSARIARAVDSRAALRRLDREELTAIDGVGPATAADVQAEFQTATS
jgi:predicted flap endonuclease-1-like 5' DNA nuclease